MTVQEYIYNSVYNSDMGNFAELVCALHLVSTKTVHIKDTKETATEHHNRLDGGCSECVVFETCPLCRINE